MPPLAGHNMLRILIGTSPAKNGGPREF